MTTLSIWMSRRPLAIITILTILVMASCRKPDIDGNIFSRPSSYSADVLDKWMTMQIRLMKNATGIANHAFSRHYAYAGIAALQSLEPGLPASASWINRWNGLSNLPASAPLAIYYYPANVNAAMAAINRAMFPNASVTDKAAIDSLEQAIYSGFQGKQSESVLNRSVKFGQDVAAAVYAWAETDNYKLANAAYTPPVGDGLWVPTPPNNSPAITPYWGNNRNIILGSIANTDAIAPPAYSIHANSPFHQMVKEVYDVSLTLTDDQKAMAAFWRDIPGVSSPGHWLSILQQVVKIRKPALDKAALAYALTGTAINDALITCFKSKFTYNLVRPVTYIRNVMGHTQWSPILGTPAHPEYSSAHSSLSAAAAGILEKLFGNTINLTDRTYDYLGYGARHYKTFSSIGEEAGQSRLYAGIHYQLSIDIGLDQGRKVANNILKHGKFTD